MSQKGFTALPLIIFLVVGIIGGGLFFNKEKLSISSNQSKEISNSKKTSQSVKESDSYNPSQKNSTLYHQKSDIASSQKSSDYFNGVPCTSNPNVNFTHDFSEVDKIKSVEPTIITPGNSRHRAWLNITSGKVAIFAPVDSELVNGVYKNARGALDYDLHFQASCEIWYLINHVTEPVDKIKNAFPQTPQTDTRDGPPFKESIKFKAGELLGYTTGTPLAHNFDFGVFDLNNFNEGLPKDEGSKYGKEINFICPFDVLPEDIKEAYYKKIISQEKPFTNCKSTD